MNHHKTDCVLDIPYPQVSSGNGDKQIAGMLYQIYAGPESELSSISDYSYQSILFEDKFPIASDLLECISIVEMRHFKMLGRLILMLGFNPVIKFTDGIRKNKVFLRAPSVNETYFKNAIYQDISDEKTSLEAYRQLAESTTDGEIRALIRRIMLDERHHIELLTELLK